MKSPVETFVARIAIETGASQKTVRHWLHGGDESVTPVVAYAFRAAQKELRLRRPNPE